MELTIQPHPAEHIPFWIGLFFFVAGLTLSYFSPRIVRWQFDRLDQRSEEQMMMGCMYPWAVCGGMAWLAIFLFALFMTAVMILSGHAVLGPAPVEPRKLIPG